jgi:hypothetical protein
MVVVCGPQFEKQLSHALLNKSQSDLLEPLVSQAVKM